MNITTAGKRPARIEWMSQFKYDEAVALARQTNRPILINLHSESSVGCRKLQERLFSEPSVVERVNRHTVPVRVDVDTTEADPVTASLVGSHIFIWSQTVQLVSPDGDIYHKFLGAPRHTRLDMGYTRVHHDVDGELGSEEFLAQLQLALGKEALSRGLFDRALNLLRAVAPVAPPDGPCREEAHYWTTIAENRGSVTERGRRVTPTKTPLARAVERFCEALVEIPDSQLMLDWHGSKPAGDWAHYTDCLREVVFGAYQRILDAAHDVAGERASHAMAPTLAQRMLRSHQIAYRDLQGLVVGLRADEFDRVHLRENRSLGKQRTIRNNLVHCVMAEWWAHAPAIRGTLRMTRENALANPTPAADTLARFGEPPNNFGEIGALIARSEIAHRALLDEFEGITDAEVDARAQWWESAPVSIRFRLGRFGWHLHDHAMVIETILERIGRKRTETERLARMMYRALGEFEGALLGMPRERCERAAADVARFVDGRAVEVEALADTFVQKQSN